METLVVMLPSLIELDCSDLGYHLLDEHLAIFQQHLRGLHRVRVVSWKVSSEALAEFIRTTLSSNLTIFECGVIDDAGVAALSACSNIRRLKWDCTVVTNAQGMVATCKGYSFLEHVHWFVVDRSLSFQSVLTNDIVREIAQTCSCLKTIEVGNKYGLTADVWPALCDSAMRMEQHVCLGGLLEATWSPR